MSETRRTYRRVLRLPVRLQVESNPSQVLTSTTRDISTTGAYLEGVGAQPGDIVNIVLIMDEHEVLLKGQVVRREPEGLGIRFSESSVQASAVLAALVASVFDPHLISLE